MMKRLECNDLFEGCDAVVEADTTDEVLTIAAQHAQEVHEVEVTPELAQAVAAQIKETTATASS